MSAAEVFAVLVEKATSDPYVIGLFLTGSRGKGFANDYSDYDVTIILRDNAPEGVKQTYCRFAEHSDIEIFPNTLDELREFAAFGSTFGWARYGFSHVQAVIDKTGELQPVIEAKGRLPKEKRTTFLRDAVDAYLNSTYRSLKCYRSSNLLGAKLEAVAGIPALLDVIFGLDGRHAPYLGYLEKELRVYPLERFPLGADAFLQCITTMVDTADVPSQQQLLLIIEKLCCAEGMGDVFTAWGDAYLWMKHYQPKA